MSYPNLFSPLRVGTRTIRNRVALPATLTNYGRANRVTDPWRNFLVERAKGGVGLIVSEIIAVDPEALAHQAIVTGYDNANEEAFKATAGQVHAAGATLVGQLWHPGRQQLWHPTKAPMGVSDQPDALSWTVPHVMSGDEVRRVADAYIATAERLHRCGFAGVELHGAHGYLIGQFLSPWSNTRVDGFGGDVDGRTRFARDVAAGIRARCGADFIVGLKMPGDEGVDGGIDSDEAARITTRLARTGNFDYFGYGQGNFSLSLETHVPDLHFEPGHYIDIHRKMRAAAGGVPVMALGRIGTPELAEKVIAEGYGDLVGTTRALIADPAWPAKAEGGRADAIRPSVFDNWCWGEVHMGKPLLEHHNPYLGEAGEAFAEENLPPASEPRRVAIVGSGPGGLEAAWVAAARGHQVTLYAASNELGGKLRLDAALPGRGEVARMINYQSRKAAQHQVALRLGVRVDAATLLADAPDVVVLATGARLRRPPVLSADSDLGVDAQTYVTAPTSGKTALFYDMDHGPSAYGVTDLLAEHFRKVILVTPRPQIAQGVNYCSAIGVHRRLHQRRVEIVPSYELVSYKAREVICRNMFTGEDRAFKEVDQLVYVTPRQAVDDLATQLEGKIELYQVGDCRSPRNLMAAIHGGHRTALAL